ncbi:hypothetical protein [Burkholderia sp. Bp9099]|uniref:hypothetical protein n=1 Tax=Burkholderia sp. Bp9099 TaxID=2184568 RepID=UPI000F5E126C|nr:hypothetical protein [Burkholderia sp. Bp9099]
MSEANVGEVIKHLNLPVDAFKCVAPTRSIEPIAVRLQQRLRDVFRRPYRAAIDQSPFRVRRFALRFGQSMCDERSGTVNSACVTQRVKFVDLSPNRLETVRWLAVATVSISMSQSDRLAITAVFARGHSSKFFCLQSLNDDIQILSGGWGRLTH